MTIVRSRNYVAFAFSAVLLSGVANAGPGLTTPEPVGPFLDGAFPSTSPGTSPDAAWVQENYYPGLTFVEPIRIVEHPVLDRLVVVGKDGKGWSVTHAPGATDKQLFFDISSIMHGKASIAEGGISDLVFHPEFGQNGSPNANYVYISYRWAPGKWGTFDENPTVDGYNRMSRFSVVNGRVDLSTEVVLLNQFDREQWPVAVSVARWVAPDHKWAAMLMVDLQRTGQSRAATVVVPVRSVLFRSVHRGRGCWQAWPRRWRGGGARCDTQ